MNWPSSCMKKPTPTCQTAPVSATDKLFDEIV